MLLAANADLELKDSFGDTPLHSAAMHGRVKFIEWLHEKGADFTAVNAEGLSAIDLARREHKTAVVELLEELAAK